MAATVAPQGRRPASAALPAVREPAPARTGSRAMAATGVPAVLPHPAETVGPGATAVRPPPAPVAMEATVALVVREFQARSGSPVAPEATVATAASVELRPRGVEVTAAQEDPVVPAVSGSPVTTPSRAAATVVAVAQEVSVVTAEPPHRVSVATAVRAAAEGSPATAAMVTSVS